MSPCLRQGRLSTTHTCAISVSRNERKCKYIKNNSTNNMVISSPPDKMAPILAEDNLKCIFLNENDGILIQISWKFVPSSPIDNKQTSIGWGNGLAPNRRQAITWTKADPVHWCLCVALGGDELILDTYRRACWPGSPGCLWRAPCQSPTWTWCWELRPAAATTPCLARGREHGPEEEYYVINER